ncbi:MAG: hypothetical protein AAB571_06150 [Chloroflexota bacterium]
MRDSAFFAPQRLRKPAAFWNKVQFSTERRNAPCLIYLIAKRIVTSALVSDFSQLFGQDEAIYAGNESG